MQKHKIVRSALFLLACSAFAQSTTSLRGTITDPQGGVIPEATVLLSNLENGAKRQVITNGSGEYLFPQIAPGNYQIVVERPGFSTLTRNGVRVLVNTPATHGLQMEIGETREVA